MPPPPPKDESKPPLIRMRVICLVVVAAAISYTSFAVRFGRGKQIKTIINKTIPSLPLSPSVSCHRGTRAVRDWRPCTEKTHFDNYARRSISRKLRRTPYYSLLLSCVFFFLFLTRYPRVYMSNFI